MDHFFSIVFLSKIRVEEKSERSLKATVSSNKVESDGAWASVCGSSAGSEKMLKSFKFQTTRNKWNELKL